MFLKLQTIAGPCPLERDRAPLAGTALGQHPAPPSRDLITVTAHSRGAQPHHFSAEKSALRTEKLNKKSW